MFINREEELKALSEKLNSNTFEFVVIYGRRRIGKTKLALKSVENREHIYYLAVEGDNLKHFKRYVSKVVPTIEYAKEDWEAYFNFLKDKIIIIDEFPNLIKENPNILSLFQRIVDVHLKDTKTKLIILGSSISMMGEKILSYKSPLYGRKTGVLKIRPLKFKHLKEFFPNATWKELVEIYGFADGIPYYLEKIKLPFWDYLEEEIKRVDSFLRYEVDFLMKYEFEEPTTYKKILEAISFGNHSLGEIKNYLGVKHSDITPYLKNLIETEFIEREIPITESPKTKRGRYYIKDNFIAFYFRYIFPNLSAIEEGIFEIGEIKNDYNQYLGFVFEKVAKEFLIELNKNNKLPFKFLNIGRWWKKGEEIDLIALNKNEKKALFVEVKWKNLKDRDIKKILNDLKRKSELVELGDYEKYYAIIGRRVENKEDKDCLVFDLDDFDKYFSTIKNPPFCD
ncbi:ATPase [Methanocaldococcus villosus KIN24-T80]|uniref:ATPase n=1 Tax=Methanocaldococcus villosus KIN24-T80 TaxID=1069083 RepID=N6VSR4_9EURY|nr:ATP-binding protein [Methanocaldococcus villosus]ENN96236.1 ATPase [Methanocaldococcus villosus KIN24-T80]